MKLLLFALLAFVDPQPQQPCCQDYPSVLKRSPHLATGSTPEGGALPGEPGWLGVSINPPEGETQEGLLIVDVIPDSPAELAGFKEGWRILAVNGQFAGSFRTLVRELRDSAGSDVAATFLVKRSEGSRRTATGAVGADVVTLTADVRGQRRIAEEQAEAEAESYSQPPPQPRDFVDRPSPHAAALEPPRPSPLSPTDPPSPAPAIMPIAPAPVVTRPADDLDWTTIVIVVAILFVVLFLMLRR